ncbi:MAG: FHA domain-containing protein [Clostridiales bacterium]|nr:FHA domain-containing protein [Clostridiales bacterium]
MNSTVEKRNYLTYAILNAITFGIYGVIIRSKIGQDIETVCARDGQEQKHSFTQAWFYSKLYNLMIAAVICIPLMIIIPIGSSVYSAISSFGLYRSSVGSETFIAILAVFAVMIVLSFALEGLYMPSWWYTQHNRLVLNAHRMEMILNDTAFDTAVWRSLVFIPMNVFSVLGYGVCIAGMAGFVMCLEAGSAGYAFLSIFGGYLLGAILLFIKNIINLPLYYTMKSLNRFAENMGVSYTGEYDPMNYKDEDNKNNIFSRLINVLSTFGTDKKAVPAPAPVPDYGATVIKTDKGHGVYKPPVNPPAPPVRSAATIECLAGTNKGFTFNITEGEEMIIGKDPKVASIVISPEFNDVSRKHCGIRYSSAEARYYVTDYSSNGTKVDGVRIEAGKRVAVRKGSRVALGRGDNVFVLK